jgi:hypothetical protein
LVLEHFAADAFAMVNLMGKVCVTVGTLRGNCWFVRLLFNGFWKPQNWPRCRAVQWLTDYKKCAPTAGLPKDAAVTGDCFADWKEPAEPNLASTRLMALDDARICVIAVREDESGKREVKKANRVGSTCTVGIGELRIETTLSEKWH